jgi:hypothetical protein
VVEKSLVFSSYSGTFHGIGYILEINPLLVYFPVLAIGFAFKTALYHQFGYGRVYKAVQYHPKNSYAKKQDKDEL